MNTGQLICYSFTQNTIKTKGENGARNGYLEVVNVGLIQWMHITLKSMINTTLGETNSFEANDKRHTTNWCDILDAMKLCDERNPTSSEQRWEEGQKEILLTICETMRNNRNGQ